MRSDVLRKGGFLFLFISSVSLMLYGVWSMTTDGKKFDSATIICHSGSATAKAKLETLWVTYSGVTKEKFNIPNNALVIKEESGDKIVLIDNCVVRIKEKE